MIVERDVAGRQLRNIVGVGTSIGRPNNTFSITPFQSEGRAKGAPGGLRPQRALAHPSPWCPLVPPGALPSMRKEITGKVQLNLTRTWTSSTWTLPWSSWLAMGWFKTTGKGLDTLKVLQVPYGSFSSVLFYNNRCFQNQPKLANHLLKTKGTHPEIN